MHFFAQVNFLHHVYLLHHLAEIAFSKVIQFGEAWRQRSQTRKLVCHHFLESFHVVDDLHVSLRTFQ